jgi:hypothetical protein
LRAERLIANHTGWPPDVIRRLTVHEVAQHLKDIAATKS